MKFHPLPKLAALLLIVCTFLPLGGQTGAAAQPFSSPPALSNAPSPLSEIAYSPTITTTTYLPLIAHNFPYGPAGWVVLTTQDFEEDFPPGWNVYDHFGNDGLEFFWASKNCRPYPGGGYSGWAIGGGVDGSGLACGSLYPSDADSWMVYGAFSLVNTTAADLKFKAWYDTADSSDQLCVGASPNGATFYQVCRHGTSNGWVDMSLNLGNIPGYGSMLNRSKVWVGIQFISYTFAPTKKPEGAYVDNILLRKCPSGATCASQSTTTATEGVPAVHTLPSP